MGLLYWLIAVMPLDQHWLWGHEIFGVFTTIKLLGLLSLFIAVIVLATGRVPFRRLYSGRNVRWYWVTILLLSIGKIQTTSEMRSTAFSHVLSFVTLFIIVLAMVTSGVRLNRILL